MKFQNILVAIDGSQHSFDAAEIAALIAGQNQAPITLVHVIPGGPIPDALKEYARVEHLEPTQWLYEKQVAERVLEAAAARFADTDLAVTRRTEQGDPAGKILDAARDIGCDLIVIGHRGTGDVESLLMGSVAHKLNHKARCSVITVKH